MKKIVLSMALAVLICFATSAQEESVNNNPAVAHGKTATSLEELNAERAALVELSKSEAFLEKLAKAEKLKTPKDIGIGGVDALTGIVSKMLAQLKENRNIIPQMYASVTGQTIDGSAATGTTKISVDQLENFSKMFVDMGSSLVQSSKELIDLPGEIKSAGVMKGLKALKSVAYIKNAIGILKQEISYNAKMVKNLIETNKLMNKESGTE